MRFQQLEDEPRPMPDPECMFDEQLSTSIRYPDISGNGRNRPCCQATVALDDLTPEPISPSNASERWNRPMRWSSP